MKDEYKIARLQNAALVEIELLKQEFEMIVKHTRKQEPSILYEGIELFDFSEDDIRELFEKRKDRKYAALTMELYAIAEQMLKDMYESIHSVIYKKRKANNVIQDLEDVLKSHLVIKNKGTLKKLAMLRNYIVHNTFSMKKARREKEIDMKSKDLYSELHQEVVDYINSISYKIN